MVNEEHSIVTVDNDISTTSIQGMLGSIRPLWQGKGLIKRVQRLLPVDASSACQRLLNAAIFDLREKVVTIGIDIAREVAKTYSLPPIVKDEDVLENYSTSNIIDLSYRIGLLRRSEWRRVQRCYEIRKDLEHEDNEYEAVLEDCFYIFKSSIEVVLSQDPIELLQVTDVKQIIEEPQKITVSEDLLNDYEHAPDLRQKEIIKFLISTAKDDGKPDISRGNAFEILRRFKTKTKTSVTISIAKSLEESLDRNPIDLVTAKLGHAIGATVYFKKVKIKDYYKGIIDTFKSAGTNWDEQTRVVSIFHNIGHFTYCPNDLIKEFLNYLVMWYIGEPGGYGQWGQNRTVFYSNEAAPVIKRIIEHSPIKLDEEIEHLREDRNIKNYLTNKYILARFENLLDLIEIKNIYER